MNAMGRLNASTEIIPLQGPSGRNEARFRQNFRPKPKPYFVDPHIVPRVKQYLEDHKDTVHVDMDAMVDELQRKYKDYARRKRNAFKQSVDKAFKTVLQQYGVSGDYDGGDLENSESSDEEMYSEDVSLENSSNTQAAGQLMNMYMNRPGLSVTPGLRPSDRMNLLSYQRPVLHRLHHHGDGIYIRPSIKQEPLEFRQRGFTAFQR
ncbi:hypothetical protein R5R35_000240 [Gryllus longicercus]|uniref:NVL2 nucleolin binding domain-containing protein n=1 Tax=Gryllus longicercus TaxID=2509291 RepID=A0AAN9VQZ1_9ORTH